MSQRVSYCERDITSRLPEGWRKDIGAVAAEADFREFPRTPILSREAPDVTHVERGRVHAETVMDRLPWLYKLYRNDFLELATEAWGEPIDAAYDDRYGVVLNVQRGKTMRFECHVDSNPVTGILFLTSHPAVPWPNSSSPTTRTRWAWTGWSRTARSSGRKRAGSSSSTERPTRTTRGAC